MAPPSRYAAPSPLRHPMIDQITEAWRTNHRINLMVLDAVTDAGLDCTLSTRGGRGVRGEFAHMHTNRVWALEKRAPDLAEGLAKYTAKDAPTRAQLRKAHVASAKAIEQFFIDAAAGVTKARRRTMRKGLPTHLAYFVAHEAHHRGRILLTLKVSGETIDKDVASGIWGWDQV